MAKSKFYALRENGWPVATAELDVFDSSIFPNELPMSESLRIYFLQYFKNYRDNAAIADWVRGGQLVSNGQTVWDYYDATVTHVALLVGNATTSIDGDFGAAVVNGQLAIAGDLLDSSQDEYVCMVHHPSFGNQRADTLPSVQGMPMPDGSQDDDNPVVVFEVKGAEFYCPLEGCTIRIYVGAY